MPEKIDSMIKNNYKKVAYISKNQRIRAATSPSVPFDEFKENVITLNLNFVPSRLIILMDFKLSSGTTVVYSTFSLDSQKHKGKSNASELKSTSFTLYLDKITKSSASIYAQFFGYSQDEESKYLTVTRIVAIE